MRFTALAFSRRSPRGGLLSLAIVFLVGLTLHAAESERASGSYSLTAWTAEWGAHDDVNAIAQDHEGFLWLGTNGGLVRFDGLQFSVWGTRGEPALPAKTVQAVVASHDGSLWVAYGNAGGVSRIHNGGVVNYAASDGLPRGPVSTLLEDRQGTVWAGGLGGLSRFVDNRWTPLGAQHGFPGSAVITLYEDERRRLWVGTAVGIYRGEADRFELVDANVKYVNNLTEDRTGAIWVTDTYEIVRRLSGGDRPRHLAGVRLPTAGWRLARDSRGDLWITAVDTGLLHLRSRDDGSLILERFDYETKISGSPRPVFRDRDNNIWVGMRGGGLLRISESVIVNNTPLEGVTNDGVHTMAASDDGSVWVATGHSVNRFKAGARTVYGLAQSLALHTDRTGTLWAATTQGISRFVDGRFVKLPIPNVMRWSRTGSIAADARGALWICNMDQGLFQWYQGAVTQFEQADEIGRRPCSNVHADSAGRVWIGFPSGGVAVHEGGRFHSFKETDGLAGGAILAFHEDQRGALWVSTATGLSRFQNDRWTTVTATNLPLARLVPAILEDAEGYLWVGINSGSGILRFNPSEVDKVALNASYQIEYVLLDVSDGLLGDIRLAGRPSAVRGTDGKLWFATGTGVAIIEPQRLPRSVRPLPPRIDRVVVNGRTLNPAQDFAMPPRNAVLTVDFSALSLAAASKLRFRYMLEGFDPNWIEASPQRQASYTAVPPGRYRFLVSVTNDGLWSEATRWSFSVPAPFYQRTSFLALSVIGAALMIAVMWWMRLRAVRNQFALVFAERERLSREIHDTLLQSLSAINLELEATASQLGPSEAATETLRRLRKRVVRTVREARGWIWELRSHDAAPRDLSVALQQVAKNMTLGKPVQMDVVVTGRSRRCSADMELQLLRIGQEAVSNAVRHGRATRLHVALDYRGDSIMLRVADDGSGFLPDDQAAASGDHWGLVLMKERAKRIGGRLAIASRPGEGTVIEVTAPLMSAG